MDIEGLERATVMELSSAIAARKLSAVDLTAAYLRRIDAVDRCGPRLNAVPVVDEGALDEAGRLDEELRRGRRRGPLHGIPFVVKDSYSVRGLTVANGSPAFRRLRATADAFVVGRLRAAGAIPLGKTTMPPMAAGGMQRGLYGRAESPFNPDYLCAAWFSGSSNGSGVAVAAGLAAFALAEETLSSGRSPASNNGLVAYTPSRGMLSMRGNWPFLAIRDVVVPYARTVSDLLLILEAIWVDDPETAGDLWRAQRWVPLPGVSAVRPKRLASLEVPGALRGRRIAVPAQLVGQKPAVGGDFVLDPEVEQLWARAVSDLESLGADVFVVDVSAMSHYEGWIPDAAGPEDRGWVPHDFIRVEGGDLAASGWDEFLRGNGDPHLMGLEDADAELIFPEHLRGFPDALNPLPRHDWVAMVASARGGARRSLDTPGLEHALRGIERYRRELLDNWMGEQGIDLLAFPAATGVGPANADCDPDACRAAWRRGIEHSTGGFTVRHLGLPTVTVTMGQMPTTRMPVGITFASTAYRDADVISAAYAFEQAGDRRRRPVLTDLARLSC
jgi:amidase